MSAGIRLRVNAQIDRGMERDYQEDNYIVGSDPAQPEWKLPGDLYETGAWGTLLVVADGMGGLNAGEVASHNAIEGVKAYFANLTRNSAPPTRATIEAVMKNAVLYANRTILQYAEGHPDAQGMGTTLVLAWVYDNALHVAWCGDSRCYLRSTNGDFRQINFDHSYVQELVNKGEISEEDAFYHPNKNIITQSLGDVGHKPSPDYRAAILTPGDRILLCSDGLNSMLTNPQIAGYMQEPELRDSARKLIDAANDAGGYDNITVVLCEVEALNNQLMVPDVPPVSLLPPEPLPPSLPIAGGSTFFKVTRSTMNWIIGVAVVIGFVLIGFLLRKHNVYDMIMDTQKSEKSIDNTGENVEKSSANNGTSGADNKANGNGNGSNLGNMGDRQHKASGASTTTQSTTTDSNPPAQDQSKRINFEPLLKAAKEAVATDKNTVILDALLAHIRAPNNISEDFICNKVNELERGAIDIEYVRNYAKEHFGCNLSTIPPQNLGKSGDLVKKQERLPDLPKDCLAGPRKFGVALTSFSTAERAILEVENKRGLKEYKEVDYIVKDKDIFRCVIQCNSWSKATQKRDELTRAGVKCFAINFCKGDIVKEF